METTATFERVVAILRSEMMLRAGTEVSAQMHLIDDLGADSLDMISIALELNDCFLIDLDERELFSQVETVQDLVQLVMRKKEHR